MKAVILAGGLGTRISEETQVRPKPMVEIGGKPILWHIMKMYSAHGINDFVICCGYKGYVIKEYFANYFLHMSDVTFDMTTNQMQVHQRKAEPWKVTLVDTGEDTMTGGRLKRVRRLPEGEEAFCFTYGDGVADIDISASVEFHKAHGKLATVTAVQPAGPLRRAGARRRVGQRLHRKAARRRRLDQRRLLRPLAAVPRRHRGRRIELGSARPAAHRGRRPAAGVRAPRLLAADGHACATRPSSSSCGPRARRRGRCGNERRFLGGPAVFVTGHTGFKGSWLALMLHERRRPRLRLRDWTRRPIRACSPSPASRACSPAIRSPTSAMPTR